MTRTFWGYVQITVPPMVEAGGDPLEPAASYLSFEGEVPWEPEHGLELVFEDGRRIGRSVLATATAQTHTPTTTSHSWE